MRTRNWPVLSAFILLPALLHGQAGTSAPPHPPAATGATVSCHVDRSEPSPAEQKLAAEDYKAAEAGVREILAADPTSERAQLGLVRAMVGEDKVSDAETLAASMLAAKPSSALALTAVSEAAYRAGDMDKASEFARRAAKTDLCSADALTVFANILYLNAYHGSAARLVDQAHRLRPNDERIRRVWIQSLPHKRRQEELALYLGGQHAVSPEAQHGLDSELAHLKTYRPGECRITSKAMSTKLTLTPLYGASTHPVAFGLDVKFNNIGRRMQIDTGASGIVLSDRAAHALKLQPEYTFKSGGVGDEGKVDSYLAHVEKIQIGDVEVSNCMVEVVNKTKLDVDGLIGMDVFDRWLVTLDYAEARVQLDPLPMRPEPAGASAVGTKASIDDSGEDEIQRDRYIAPEMKDWGRVLRLGHNIFLPAHLSKTGPTHFLIMDTGASATNLSTEMGREIGKLHGSEVEFIGLSGKVKKVYETDRTPLTVANLSLWPSEYYAYDMSNLSHDLGFAISGLLGLPTLQRLTIKIDYRDNLLQLTYDPSHDVVRF